MNHVVLGARTRDGLGVIIIGNHDGYYQCINGWNSIVRYTDGDLYDVRYYQIDVTRKYQARQLNEST